ncbi:MAG: hypothetical protein QOJ64_1196 [Acidobacteriota bacterium]|jgi:hypothetical protein|nr:hypothetical protein [Acidobacteriota bacterium]
MLHTRQINVVVMLFLAWIYCSFLVEGSVRQDTVPSASPTHLDAMQSVPFPDVQIPGMPSEGEWCLTRVDKAVEGTARYVSPGGEYTCEGGHTWRGKVKINTTLRASGRACDQGDFIPNGSVLNAEGEIIRRRDGFAHFAGKFEIKSGDKQLFEGRMELLFRVGSHRGESCDDISHYEGWLVGRGSKGVPLSLRAMISGKWTAPMPRLETTWTSGSILSGIVVRPR